MLQGVHHIRLEHHPSFICLSCLFSGIPAQHTTHSNLTNSNSTHTTQHTPHSNATHTNLTNSNSTHNTQYTAIQHTTHFITEAESIFPISMSRMKNAVCRFVLHRLMCVLYSNRIQNDRTST